MQHTGKKKHFRVTEMTKDKFYDFALLLKGYLQLRKDVRGNPFSWRQIQWLQHRKDTPEVIFFKASLDPFSAFNLKEEEKNSLLIDFKVTLHTSQGTKPVITLQVNTVCIKHRFG